MKENMNGSYLDLIIHPGETIKELLEEKEMTQEELAIRTGYSAKHVSEVLSGKKNISSNFANSLEYVFDIPTEFWINLQGNYDKEILEVEKINNIKKEEFDVLDELKDIVKYCEVAGIIEANTNKSLTLLNMRKFLNVNNLLSIVDLPLQLVSFRGSKKIKVNTNILYAWKRICEYSTKEVTTSKKFDKKKLKEKCFEIKKTMFLEPNEMIEELKKIFLECGIVFDVVHNFVGAPVQGYIQKRKNRVLLCMTIRQSFADVFWFTLFHEIGHLINDDFKNQYIDYYFIEDTKEKKADAFARNELINDDAYEQFIKTKKYSFSIINDFAKSQGVKPGIVIGRLQKDFGDYTFMARYRERYKWIDNI
jgi:HTH-type transcriptional regulator / antitoxin HigA